MQKEIEKVKKRREERELDKAQWEEEKARLQREQDAQSFQDWESKEDEVWGREVIREMQKGRERERKREREGEETIKLTYKLVLLETSEDGG